MGVRENNELLTCLIFKTSTRTKFKNKTKGKGNLLFEIETIVFNFHRGRVSHWARGGGAVGSMPGRVEVFSTHCGVERVETTAALMDLSEKD